MMYAQLFRLELRPVALEDVRHRKELFLAVHALEELEGLLASDDQACVFDLVE